MKTHKRAWLLIGILACSAVAILAAVKNQKSQKHVPFTITFRAEDRFDDGRVVQAFTETRYVSSSGDWRSLRQLSSGAVIERVGIAGRGVYTIDSQAQKMWFNSPYSDTFPKAGERRRNSNYLRTETILGYAADVIKLEAPGKSFELFQARELSGFIVKQVERGQGVVRVIEPTSIIAGEPDKQSLNFTEYPEDRSAYRPSGIGFNSPPAQQGVAQKRKTLRELGQERDVETAIPGQELENEYSDLGALVKSAQVIVVGRINDEESSFSGDDHIVTTYTVDVQRVLKDTTSQAVLRPQDARPLPVTSSLKFLRSGGTVTVNGHRVSMKLRGGEMLKPGKDYVLFLWWSPNFESYRLLAGSSGAFLVKENLRVQPLGYKKPLQEKTNDIDLEALINEVLKSGQ
ncbi:MAG TPA: hypothetical protein VJS44_15240 [Pyrinomonadaceae bacterium]|nr:hypothetical protein [Pyrinomonadaceae bacterium]